MKYVRAFHIADVVLANRRLYGETYRSDVLRVAALAAVETDTGDAAADAVERAFYACRLSINPRWDGSIA